MLGGTQLEGGFAEKDLGILVDTNLNMNQQHALALKKANYSWMHQAKYQQQGKRGNPSSCSPSLTQHW